MRARSGSCRASGRRAGEGRQSRSGSPAAKRNSSSPSGEGRQPRSGSPAARRNSSSPSASPKQPTTAPPESAVLPDGRHLVFPYGTLRTGFHNNHYLDGAECRGCGTTVDSFRMFARNPRTEYHASIPFVAAHGKGATVDAPEVQIHGEVYAVTDEQLKMVDGLEMHPEWYHREVIFVRLGGAIMPCWLYFNEQDMCDAERLVAVPSGDFCDHKAAPPPPADD